MDLLLAHWSLNVNESNRYLWRNNGDLTFTNGSDETNLYWDSNGDLSFSPGFADINNDGLQDVLFVADGGTSRVFLNQPSGIFVDITTDQISDKSGMGSAFGDYDNDGDLDWFVSSIFPVGHKILREFLGIVSIKIKEMVNSSTSPIMQV